MELNLERLLDVPGIFVDGSKPAGIMLDGAGTITSLLIIKTLLFDGLVIVELPKPKSEMSSGTFIFSISIVNAGIFSLTNLKIRLAFLADTAKFNCLHKVQQSEFGSFVEVIPVKSNFPFSYLKFSIFIPR